MNTTDKYIKKPKPCGQKLSARLERVYNRVFGTKDGDLGYSQGNSHYYRENGQWFQEVGVKNPDYNNEFQTYCVIPSDERQDMRHFFIKLRPDTPKKKWYPAVHKAMKLLGAKNNLHFLNLEFIAKYPEEKMERLFILQDSGEVIKLK